MPITLDVQLPDHLKVAFDESPYLQVVNDADNQARDALLVWLLSSTSGLWLSDFPEDAERVLRDRFLLYPRVRFDHLTFTTPGKLTRVDFQRCVIEDVAEFDVKRLRTKETRILERVYEGVTPVDALGLSLEDRKELLKETRLGSATGYDEYELIASVTRESYFEFVKEFWGQVIAETPIWNWHIEFLAEELQTLAERVFKNLAKLYDLVINVPPGSTKSTLCSIMFSPWTWTRMPSSRFLGGSYAANLAMDLSRKNRDVVLSDKYRRAFPEIGLSPDQKAKAHFVNTKGGCRFSFGMQGTVMGMHAHFIGIDDPLNPEKAVSEKELEKANRVMSETLFTRKVDKAVTPTILIMQRLHQNDCTQHTLDTYEDVRHICLPAEDGEDVKPVELRAKYVNKLLDPVRLSQKILGQNFKALGEFGYAGQFGQRPTPRGGAMFKPGRITIDTPPHLGKFEDLVRYWDKAATHGGGAYTAGVLMGLDSHSRFWVLDVVRGQWSMDEREATIKQTAGVDGRELRIRVEQEPGGGGKDQALYTIKNLAGWRIEADRVGAAAGNKTARAGPFADQVNAGNVYMVKANWNKAYLDELRYFPASKYKDQVDASSGAFNDLTRGEIEVGTI